MLTNCNICHCAKIGFELRHFFNFAHGLRHWIFSMAHEFSQKGTDRGFVVYDSSKLPPAGRLQIDFWVLGTALFFASG